MMSEFMIQFNNMKDQIMPIIFFAATNVQSSIDRAILRRFSNKEHFKNPSENEILQFINQLFFYILACLFFANKYLTFYFLCDILLQTYFCIL